MIDIGVAKPKAQAAAKADVESITRARTLLVFSKAEGRSC
jgi:hypothetical protein